MSNLIELTADIVISHASMTEMSSEELLKEIRMVYATLKGLELGESEFEEMPALLQEPAMTIEEAFKPDEVCCMICGKTGLTTLKRHLTTAHNMKPGEYRKHFNVPKDQPLAATEYVEKRRRMALDKGLGKNLAKARKAATKKPKMKTTKKAKK
jgi:predicted transcriptional regulator